ncbi:hypothetical protein NL676_011973 [Syzygium grande]|nr:hypothetical protein NL676_011973 [Syzygium grande]
MITEVEANCGRVTYPNHHDQRNAGKCVDSRPRGKKRQETRTDSERSSGRRSSSRAKETGAISAPSASKASEEWGRWSSDRRRSSQTKEIGAISAPPAPEASDEDGVEQRPKEVVSSEGNQSDFGSPAPKAGEEWGGGTVERGREKP